MRRYLIVAEKLGQHIRRLFRGELQKQVAHARRYRQRGKHHGMREHIHKIERRSAHDRGPDLGVAPDLFQKNLGGNINDDAVRLREKTGKEFRAVHPAHAIYGVIPFQDRHESE